MRNFNKICKEIKDLEFRMLGLKVKKYKILNESIMPFVKDKLIKDGHDKSWADSIYIFGISWSYGEIHVSARDNGGLEFSSCYETEKSLEDLNENDAKILSDLIYEDIVYSLKNVPF